MILLQACALIACTFGLVSRTSATSCSPSVNPCMTTKHVLDICDIETQSCACIDENYVPIPSGCAPESTLGRPTVDASPYSGEVAVGETLPLSCSHPPGFIPRDDLQVVYEWFVDGAPVAGEESQDYNHAAGVEGTQNITCKIYSDDLESDFSDSFSVIAYLGGSFYTFTKEPAIIGNYTATVDGSLPTLRCVNLPLDMAITYSWLDADLNVLVSSTDLVPSDLMTDQTYTCSLEDASSSYTLPANPSVEVFAWDTAASLLQSGTAAITSPAVDTTLALGDSIDLTCELLDVENILFSAAVDIIYAWYSDGVALAGETGHSLDTGNAILVEGTWTITCGITPTGGSEIMSTGIVITIVNNSSGVAVTVSPDPVLEGNIMIVRCLFVSDAISDSTTYAWQYDGETILGQTDHTLQIYGATDSRHGSGKVYACTVTSGDSATRGTSDPVNITPVSGAYPSITSNLMTTYYGIGDSYVLTCVVTVAPESYNLTYEWQNDGALIENVDSANLTITATETLHDYTCTATSSDEISTLISSAYTVQGIAIKQVTLRGPSAPVVGTSPVYTCEVTLPASGGDVTYHIVDSMDGILSTNSSYTFSNVSDGFIGLFHCEAIVSTFSDVSADILVAATVVPATPTVHIPHPVNEGGVYNLTCTSDSADDATPATYIGFQTDEDGFTSNETLDGPFYTIYGASAEDDDGDYSCTVTINDQTSSHAVLQTLQVGSAMGLPCTKFTFDVVCTSNFSLYTGNCIDDRCECAPGVPLAHNSCGEEEIFYQPHGLTLIHIRANIGSFWLLAFKMIETILRLFCSYRVPSNIIFLKLFSFVFRAG